MAETLITREPGYFLQVDPDCIDARTFERRAEAGRRSLAAGDAASGRADPGCRPRPLARRRAGRLPPGVGCDCGRGRAVGRTALERDRGSRLRPARHRAPRGRHRRLGRVAAPPSTARAPLVVADDGVVPVPAPGSTRCGRTSARATRSSRRSASNPVSSCGTSKPRSCGVTPRSTSSVRDAGTSARSWSIRRSARPASWTTSGPTFIGRDAEVAQLSRVWAAARDGARGAVLLGGEPGIGKTRLAAEVALIAEGDGGRVLYGRCDEGLGVPYQPFVEALRMYVETSSDTELRTGLGRYRNELVRLLPELSDRASDLATAVAVRRGNRAVPAVRSSGRRGWARRPRRPRSCSSSTTCTGPRRRPS